MADFLSAFGFPANFKLDYRTFVQLYLNLERIRLQRAVSVGFGMQIANSDSPLDEVWGDAIALDPSEASEIVYRANVERSQARSRRKGPGRFW
jgi:hypothetical protein